MSRQRVIHNPLPYRGSGWPLVSGKNNTATSPTIYTVAMMVAA